MRAISDNDLRTLLFCAVRYAVGRRSYMPSVVQEIVREHADVLTVDDRQRLAEEIRGRPDLGYEQIDAPAWVEFASWLAAEAANSQPRGHS